MDSYESHLAHCILFIDKNKSLINCHLVDFITENLWEKCLATKLRHQLEQSVKSNVDITQLFHRNVDGELNNFIEQVNILSLKNGRNVLPIEEISTFLPHIKFDLADIHKNNKPQDDFMTDKKRYEVNILTKVVGNLTTPNSNLVIDVGAGNGYLATSLSENYSIPVLAIDCDESRHESAVQRQRKKHQSYPLVRYSIEFIDETTDYLQLVQSSFHKFTVLENGFTLAGLHTCGRLPNAMIKSFLNSPCLNILCVVSCCYHLTDESLSGKYYITRNARMLAQQSVERELMKNNRQALSLFYRAVLQVLLKSLGMAEVRIGKRAPLENFAVYAKWSLKKVGIEDDKIPSDQQLEQLYDEYHDKQWQMQLFQLLRIYAGSVVEAAIVLDRAFYLYQSQTCTKVAIIKFFDPLLSPRCYGIIAIK